jgi:hypothetical protein
MPQMLSTDSILMAAQDMSDALKHPHLDVPFATTIEDDTITALATLSEIFTKKITKPEANNVPPSPQKTASNKRHDSELQPVITSPIKHYHQPRTETNTNQKIENVQQPPRVVKPSTARGAPPRVQARPHQLSPQHLSQGCLDLGGANCAIAFGEDHWTKTHMMNSIIHPSTGHDMRYKDLMKDPDLGPSFEICLSNELGQICEGIWDIAGTNAAFFIDLKSIPKNRRITYGKLVCDFKPNKSEKYRVRLTVGGDRLDYRGDTATSTADITMFKILINSTLSTQEEQIMMMDIKNYYLGTPLPTHEYMRLPISILPLDIIEKYDLKRLSVNSWVYLEIRKGMYGLKQAGLLANQLLQKRLKPFGYYAARHTHGLWLQNTKPTAFSLVVDDFAVKYVTKADAHHLRNALLRHYEITTHWDGTVYSGIALDWDYNKRTCDISMPDYTINILN